MNTEINPSPVFRASWRMPRHKGITQGPIEPTPELAASHIPASAKVATVLRDSQGTDHPDNAGKFFLHRIIR